MGRTGDPGDGIWGAAGGRCIDKSYGGSGGAGDCQHNGNGFHCSGDLHCVSDRKSAESVCRIDPDGSAVCGLFGLLFAERLGFRKRNLDFHRNFRGRVCSDLVQHFYSH